MHISLYVSRAKSVLFLGHWIAARVTRASASISYYYCYSRVNMKYCFNEFQRKHQHCSNRIDVFAGTNTRGVFILPSCIIFLGRLWHHVISYVDAIMILFLGLAYYILSHLTHV